jgi:hypothetical protein
LGEHPNRGTIRWDHAGRCVVKLGEGDDSVRNTRRRNVIDACIIIYCERNMVRILSL